MSSESFGAYRCAASWKKVDLHLHSPGVDSFRLPPGSNIETEEGIKEIAAAYVRSLSAAGIQVAAITDYQGIREEWFTRIRDEAERAGIKVFPGAELFFMDGKGYHILTVFEADVEPGEVNRFLDSFNRGKPLRDPGGAHSYIPCPDTRPDRILQQLKTSFNCLIIVPHPGEQQGIMTALRMSNCLDQLLGIMPDAIDHAPPDLLEQSQSSQNATLLEAAGAVERLVHEIQSARTDLDAAFARTLSEVSRSRLSWEAATSTLQDEILRIKQSLKTDKLDPDRIVKLQAEAARLGPLVSGLEELRNQAAQLRGKRGELIRDLKKARRAEHEFRFEQAQRISAAVGDRIRIVVKDREQKEPLRRRLRAVLRGSGFREENLERLLRVEGIDGLSLAAAVREGPEAVVRQCGLTPSAAQGLCRWLEEDESRLFELEVASPDDLVDVELKMEEGVYRPMADLSVGQRATAVLLLLLAQENRLLVLDQPEEDLDNRFIVQDIVSILRNHKGRRQVISATHNANIVVLGDAEMVVALDVKDSRATVVQCASVDNKDVRCWIKSVMEGGDTAFRLRAENYGGGVLID